MGKAHEGILTGHNFSNGEHYYTVSVPRRGKTDEPVFYLEEDERAMQAVLKYNGYDDLTELLNSRLSNTEILLKEDERGYIIAEDEMMNQA